MSEIRSSELETRLSSNDDLVEREEDIAASGPREVRVFHTLGEAMALTLKPFPGLGIGFSFLRGLGFVFLKKRNELVISYLGRCASARSLSNASLGFPSTPLLWSF